MPEKKRILILDGHPAETSLSRALAERYADAALAQGHQVRLMRLSRMEFDPDFGRAGYADPKPHEPDVARFMDDLQWSQHVVLVTPMWWGGLPGRLKGLIDRAFLPGLAFDTRVPAGKMPRPMLGGRTARVVVTSDTPGWFMRLVYRGALFWQLRKQVFGFVGIRPARITHFTGASHVAPKRVGRWLQQVAALGAAAA